MGRTTQEILGSLREAATILEEPEENARLVALTTCFGEAYTARLLVVGTLRAE